MTAYLAVQHEAKARTIGNRQEKLIKEWGGEVKGQAAVQSDETPQQPSVETPSDEEEAAAFDEEPENG